MEGCSLRRNAVAAALPLPLFVCGDSAPGGPGEPLGGFASLSLSTALPPLGALEGSDSTELRAAHSRTLSGTLSGALSGALEPAQAGSAAVHYHKPAWDEMLGLHPVSGDSAPGTAGSGSSAGPEHPTPQSAAGAGAGSAAVHVRWQNPGPAAAVAAARGSASAADTAAQQQQRCAAHVGQVFVCWAPGFATSLVLLVQPVVAAVSSRSGSAQGEGAEPAAPPPPASEEDAAQPPPNQQPQQPADAGAAAAAGGPSPLQAVLSGMVLEAHVGALQLALLSGQEPGAAGMVLSLLQLQVGGVK